MNNQKHAYIIIGILAAALVVFAIVQYSDKQVSVPVDTTNTPGNQNNTHQTPPPVSNDDHGSSTVFTQELKYGMENNDQITKMQAYLIALGYLNGTPNGDFYSYTLAAVKKFQRVRGLPETGIVDAQTRAALNRAEDGQNTLAKSTCNLNVQTYQVVSFPLAITGQFSMGQQGQQPWVTCSLGVFEGQVGAVKVYSSSGVYLNSWAPLMITNPNFDYQPGTYNFAGTLTLPGLSSGQTVILRFEKEDPSGEHPYHFDIPVIVS